MTDTNPTQPTWPAAQWLRPKLEHDLAAPPASVFDPDPLDADLRDRAVDVVLGTLARELPQLRDLEDYPIDDDRVGEVLLLSEMETPEGVEVRAQVVCPPMGRLDVVHALEVAQAGRVRWVPVLALRGALPEAPPPPLEPTVALEVPLSSVRWLAGLDLTSPGSKAAARAVGEAAVAQLEALGAEAGS